MRRGAEGVRPGARASLRPARVRACCTAGLAANAALLLAWLSACDPPLPRRLDGGVAALDAAPPADAAPPPDTDAGSRDREPPDAPGPCVVFGVELIPEVQPAGVRASVGVSYGDRALVALQTGEAYLVGRAEVAPWRELQATLQPAFGTSYQALDGARDARGRLWLTLRPAEDAGARVDAGDAPPFQGLVRIGTDGGVETSTRTDWTPRHVATSTEAEGEAFVLSRVTEPERVLRQAGELARTLYSGDSRGTYGAVLALRPGVLLYTTADLIARVDTSGARAVEHDGEVVSALARVGGQILAGTERAGLLERQPDGLWAAFASEVLPGCAGDECWIRAILEFRGGFLAFSRRYFVQHLPEGGFCPLQEVPGQLDLFEAVLLPEAIILTGRGAERTPSAVRLFW